MLVAGSVAGDEPMGSDRAAVGTSQEVDSRPGGVAVAMTRAEGDTPVGADSQARRACGADCRGW